MPVAMNFKPQGSARGKGIHANPGETLHALPEALPCDLHVPTHTRSFKGCHG